MATETELDAEWHTLSLSEKHMVLNKCEPINDIVVNDIWRLIGNYLGREPRVFYSLIATCRQARDALGDDFYPYADKSFITMWLMRFENIIKAHGFQLTRILAVAGGRYKYICADPEGINSHGFHRICELDMESGLLLSTRCNKFYVNGFIYDRNIWSYFTLSASGRFLHFSCPEDMLSIDPNYTTRLMQLKNVHDYCTERREKPISLDDEQSPFSDIGMRHYELAWKDAREKADAIAREEKIAIDQ